MLTSLSIIRVKHLLNCFIAELTFLENKSKLFTQNKIYFAQLFLK